MILYYPRKCCIRNLCISKYRTHGQLNSFSFVKQNNIWFIFIVIFILQWWSHLCSLNELMPVLRWRKIYLYTTHGPSTVVALVITYSLSNWCIKISVFNVPRAFIIRPTGSITTSVCMCIVFYKVVDGAPCIHVFNFVWYYMRPNEKKGTRHKTSQSIIIRL